MSIEHSDEQIEDVIGDAVEIDADSLAAAAQSAGISEGDSEKFKNPESPFIPLRAWEFESVCRHHIYLFITRFYDTTHKPFLLDYNKNIR